MENAIAYCIPEIRERSPTRIGLLVGREAVTGAGGPVPGSRPVPRPSSRKLFLHIGAPLAPPIITRADARSFITGNLTGIIPLRQ